MIVTGSMGFEYKEIDGRLWANMDEVREALASLTYRAQKAEEQYNAVLEQLNDLRDIKDEIMFERDKYKAIIRTVEALTGKEIL